jgi:hypothetical protein
MVNKAVNEYWIEHIKKMSTYFKSLDYLNASNYSNGSSYIANICLSFENQLLSFIAFIPSCLYAISLSIEFVVLHILAYMAY